MSIVYVVIAEEGEYSDRNDWVAAVYTDKTEAEARVLEHSRKLHEWRQRRKAWCEQYRSLKDQVQPVLQEAIKNGLKVANYDEFVAKHYEKIGSCPEYSGAAFDRLYFVEVPLDTWGKYDYA